MSEFLFMKTISNCLFPSKTYFLRIRLKKRKKTTFPSLSISPKSVERQWMTSLLHCQVTAIKYKEAITEITENCQSTATEKKPIQAKTQLQDAQKIL